MRRDGGHIPGGSRCCHAPRHLAYFDSWDVLTKLSVGPARVSRVDLATGNSVKRLDVVGAVIVENGRVFCTQRGPGTLHGYWEFPGGKLEAGERPEDALTREIHEELACHVEVGDLVVTTTHLYEFAEVTLTTYYCTLAQGRPELSEHQASVWLKPQELLSLGWAPADVPAVHQIVADFAR